MTSKINSTWQVVEVLESGPCQHCGLVRERKNSYVIRKGKKQLIVGSNCLSLYVRPSAPPIEKPTNRAKEILQNTLDVDHTQFMIDNPDTTLVHAACYLWSVQKEYKFEDYQATLKLIEQLRYNL